MMWGIKKKTEEGRMKQKEGTRTRHVWLMVFDEVIIKEKRGKPNVLIHQSKTRESKTE